MNQTNNQSEHKLKVEFDSHISGIGVSPKVIHFLNTKYSKILKVKFPSSTNELSGRIVPVPASYHDRHVIVLPENWKETYGIKDDSAICNICEPAFASSIIFKRFEENIENKLPVITDEIGDKSIVFLGMYLRENGELFEIVSIDNDIQEAIISENTNLEFPENKEGDSSEDKEEDSSKTNEGDSSKTTLRNKIKSKKSTLSGEKKQITFENLHKLKGIEKIIEQLKDEVVHPYLDIINGKIKNPKPMYGFPTRSKNR